ncbi:sulfurtransferase [Streptomyces sp. NPDC048255]|uniref:sulfurtransferase n=1 Tax=Streptomyces sp. NPDC048255 TaxID=3154713 RepID=UPI0033CEAC79
MPTSPNSASREPVPGGSGASGAAPGGAVPGVPLPGGTGASGSGPGAGGVPGALVGVGWLAERLGAPGLVVLDASVGAHRGAGHRIAGARPFDLDGALSDHDAPAPHTLPGPAQFTEALRALGVHDTDTVVVYDGAGVYSSARAWWMLRAMGFDRAAVLDGGLPAWTAAGLPVEATGPVYEGPRGSFTARPRAGLLVGSDTVAAALADPAAAVLDARTRERFAGTAPEPRPGLRGGHMPGAVSLPFGELQRPGGLMRPAAELREAFAAVAGDRQRLYFSCGSGVTACVLALGADLAGYRELAVYDGSWSEWGMPSELPVATGPATGPAADPTGPAGPAGPAGPVTGG